MCTMTTISKYALDKETMKEMSLSEQDLPQSLKRGVSRALEQILTLSFLPLEPGKELTADQQEHIQGIQNIVAQLRPIFEPDDKSTLASTILQRPEVFTSVAWYLDVEDLARMARVSPRFRQLVFTERSAFSWDWMVFHLHGHLDSDPPPVSREFICQMAPVVQQFSCILSSVASDDETPTGLATRRRALANLPVFPRVYDARLDVYEGITEPEFVQLILKFPAVETLCFEIDKAPQVPLFMYTKILEHFPKLDNVRICVERWSSSSTKMTQSDADALSHFVRSLSCRLKVFEFDYFDIFRRVGTVYRAPSLVFEALGCCRLLTAIQLPQEIRLSDHNLADLSRGCLRLESLIFTIKTRSDYLAPLRNLSNLEYICCNLTQTHPSAEKVCTMFRDNLPNVTGMSIEFGKKERQDESAFILNDTALEGISAGMLKLEHLNVVCDQMGCTDQGLGSLLRTLTLLYSVKFSCHDYDGYESRYDGSVAVDGSFLDAFDPAHCIAEEIPVKLEFYGYLFRRREMRAKIDTLAAREGLLIDRIAAGRSDSRNYALPKDESQENDDYLYDSDY